MIFFAFALSQFTFFWHDILPFAVSYFALFEYDDLAFVFSLLALCPHEVQEPTCLEAVCSLVRLLNSMLAVFGVRDGKIGFMLMPVLKPARTSNIFTQDRFRVKLFTQIFADNIRAAEVCSAEATELPVWKRPPVSVANGLCHPWAMDHGS